MDFLPTKGIEYLLVIGYLLLLVPFWWLAVSGVRRPVAVAAAARWPRDWRGWFRVPEGLLLHRGHTWALPEGGGLFRVGLDDFAGLLIGRPEAVLLPPVGGRVDAGEPGWRLAAGGRGVDLLSPVGGEVVEVNREAVASPRLVAEDPYGRGWLLKVRAPKAGATIKNLLSGRLARAWMEETAERLSALMTPELGAVLQDGGVPVSGFARQLDPERWDQLAAALLLTADGG